MNGLLTVVWPREIQNIFTLGAFELRWYSVLFISGFILGYFIFDWFFRREKVDRLLLSPLFYTLLIATIVGARLGHCLFYDPDYYLSAAHWKEIFMPWRGGLASHGGTIALIIAMWGFAKILGKKNGFDFIWLLDRLAIAVSFAAFFIRMGNLFNSEIYGDVTDLPWGFNFRGERDAAGELVFRHPTMLYEAFTYLLLGIVLILVYWKMLWRTYRGFYVGLFLFVCFGSRFLIEFIKLPQSEFEKGMSLDMGQWLSVPFIVMGLGLLVYAFVKKVPAAAQVVKK